MNLKKFKENYLPEKFYLVNLRRESDMYPINRVTRGKNVVGYIKDYLKYKKEKYKIKIGPISDFYEKYYRPYLRI